MNTRLGISILALLSALIFTLDSCNSPEENKQQPASIRLQAFELDAPGGDQARFPRFASANAGEDKVYLSWVQDGPQPAIQLAAYHSQEQRWHALPTAVQDSAIFVNWADFPQLSQDNTGTLTLQYLKIEDPTSPYAYHVYQTQLPPAARSWSTPYRLHADSSSTEHGFISSVSLGPDSLATIWLDGRKYGQLAGNQHQHDSGEGGEMTLRFRATGANGKLGPARELDDRTCDCCNTALAPLPQGGLIAAYRNRSTDEIRDIYFSRYVNQQWTSPQPISEDGWQVYGCPVNGPALASQNSSVAIAWYTGANGGRVQLRLSQDGGASWSKLLVADSLKPIGRVQLGLLSPTHGLLSWVDSKGSLRLQAFNGEQLLAHSIVVENGFSDRKTGFPQMLVQADTAYLAWTRPQGGIGLRKVAFTPQQN